MKKLILITAFIFCVSCDNTGEVFNNQYVGQTFEGANTEYCVFPTDQDSFLPYIFRAEISSGNVREFILNDLTDDFLNIRVNRRGTAIFITGIISVTDQVEPKLKRFNVNLRIRNVEDFEIFFNPDLCLGTFNDVTSYQTIRGRFTSLNDNEVIRVVDNPNPLILLGSEMAFINNELTDGLALSFLTDLSSNPVSGQIVFN